MSSICLIPFNFLLTSQICTLVWRRFSCFIPSCYLAVTLKNVIFLWQLGRRLASSAMKKDVFISSWSKQEEGAQPPVPASSVHVWWWWCFCCRMGISTRGLTEKSPWCGIAKAFVLVNTLYWFAWGYCLGPALVLVIKIQAVPMKSEVVTGDGQSEDGLSYLLGSAVRAGYSGWETSPSCQGSQDFLPVLLK